MIEPSQIRCGFPCCRTKPLLVVLSGPSGVGKDAVLKKMKTKGSLFYYTITATTRPVRAGERDGVDYHFLSREKFQQLVEQKQFLEWACVYDNYYGVPQNEITRALKNGTDVIVKVDIQGTESIKKIVPLAISIFLMPPSLEELEKRIRQRHSETPTCLALRLQKAREEIKKSSSFDYIVVNHRDMVDETITKIESIIIAEKCRPEAPSLNQQPFSHLP